MSRLWSERLRPKTRIGLRFARDAVWAIRVRQGRGAIEVLWADRAPLPVAWLAQGMKPSDLVATLRDLCAPMRGRHVAVQVGLPDPVFVARVFELDTLPRARKAQTELAAWRLKRDLAIAEDIECASQPLGREGARELLLGIGGPKGWIEGVRHALKEADVTVDSLDATSRYHFNAFHERLAPAGSGVLIVLAHDAWSVSAWDDYARPRFIGSRWRQQATRDLAATAEDVERLVRGYVSHFPGRTVKRLFVTGMRGESEALADILRERTHGQCEHLETLVAKISGCEGAEVDPGALAVAVAR